MEKLKRAVIKEELVALTGDYKKSIVLNQMIYWSERTKDADKFREDEIKRSKMAMSREERERAEKLQDLDLFSHGWIYKSAEELSEETMMGVSKSTMLRYLNELIENQWLDKRKNPDWKGDNTFQYRVNLIKIQKDLQKLGFVLEGYSILIDQFQNENTKFNNETSEFQNEISSSKIEQPVSKWNNQFQNETTLPEITSEIISEITSKHEEEEEAGNFEVNEYSLFEIKNECKFSDSFINQIRKYMIENRLTFITVKEIRDQSKKMYLQAQEGKKFYVKAEYLVNGISMNRISDKQTRSEERERMFKEKNKKAVSGDESYIRKVPFYNWLES